MTSANVDSIFKWDCVGWRDLCNVWQPPALIMYTSTSSLGSFTRKTFSSLSLLCSVSYVNRWTSDWVLIYLIPLQSGYSLKRKWETDIHLVCIYVWYCEKVTSPHLLSNTVCNIQHLQVHTIFLLSVTLTSLFCTLLSHSHCQAFLHTHVVS